MVIAGQLLINTESRQGSLGSHFRLKKVFRCLSADRSDYNALFKISRQAVLRHSSRYLQESSLLRHFRSFQFPR